MQREFPGRPSNCAPLIEGIYIVEVFDDGSWKATTVLKYLGGGFYLVSLLISGKESRVHKVGCANLGNIVMLC